MRSWDLSASEEDVVVVNGGVVDECQAVVLGYYFYTAEWQECTFLLLDGDQERWNRTEEMRQKERTRNES